MSEFTPTDSLVIRDAYTHPKYVGEDGQGVYVMMSSRGSLTWGFSGNELKRVYNLNPSQWTTGPIWLPLSKEDYARVDEMFERLVG
jgi:hypothetical protein